MFIIITSILIIIISIILFISLFTIILTISIGHAIKEHPMRGLRLRLCLHKRHVMTRLDAHYGKELHPLSLEGKLCLCPADYFESFLNLRIQAELLCSVCWKTAVGLKS